MTDLYVMVEKVSHMLTDQNPAARRAQASGDLHYRAFWGHQRLIQRLRNTQDGLLPGGLPPEYVAAYLRLLRARSSFSISRVLLMKDRRLARNAVGKTYRRFAGTSHANEATIYQPECPSRGTRVRRPLNLDEQR